MKYLSLFICFFMIGCGFGGGESGFHRGHITDVSVSGWFCKTYEAQIMTGTGNSAVKYEATVVSQEIYQKLIQAQKTGIEVNVHYESPRMYSYCSSAHKNFIDSVEYLSLETKE